MFFFLLQLACTDNAVKVVNSIPTATITSHSNGDTVLEGYPTIFFAELADTNHKSEDLRSTWKAGDTEFCIDLPPDESGRSTCEIRVFEGMEEVSVQVSDPANDTSQTAIFVELIPNEPPMAEISSPDNQTLYYVDSKVEFVGKIGDAEDSLEELIYSWSSDLMGELNFVSTMDSEGNLTGGLFLEEGSHIITLFVEDVGLKSTAATAEIVVLPPNQSPECQFTDLNAEGFLYESSVSLFGTTTDPELANEQLTVIWTSNLDGELGTSIPTENGTVSFTTETLSVGTHLITLQATDEVGRTCSAEQEVRIGTAPTVSITPITQTVVGEGSIITLQATINDEQQSAETLEISWSSSVQGELSTVPADSAGAALLEMSPFTLVANGHIITLTVTDELGFSTSDQVSFTVNSGPSAPLLSLSPSFVLSEDDVTVVAQGSTDVEGDAITYLYEWKTDGVTTTHTAEMVPFDQTQRDEVWEIIVTSSDPYGLGQSESLTFTVLNSPPNIDSISMTPPSDVNTQNELICEALASDIDTDVDLEVSYTWTINGSPIGSNATLQLSNALVNVGDTLECTAVATDDRGLTDETTISTEIVNREPTIDYVEIVADPASNVQALLNCVVSANDPEEEELEYVYAWYQNGDLLPLETGSQLQLSQDWVNFSDEFECQAYVEDPHEAVSSTESDNLLILDAPPQVNNIFLSPSDIYTDTEITANVSVVDPEGSQPTYTCRWLVNDVEVYTGGCILDGDDYFEKNDRVKVGITANDGIQDGVETFSTEIVVSNTRPTNPEISMTPQPVHQGIEDITCRVIEASEDTDSSDVLVYTARWYIDEQEVFDEVIDENTSSILDASYTLEHDEIRCNIEVFDGDETAIVSTSAEIDRYFEIYREDFGGTEGGRTWSFHFTPPTDGVILFEYLNSDASADGTVRLESDVGGVRLELFAGWRSEIYQGTTAVPVTDRMAASNIFVADGDHWFSVNYSLSDDETSNPTTDTNTFVVTYIPNEALDVSTSTALDISNFSQCSTCCHAPGEGGDFDLQLASGYNFGVSSWVLFEATDCGNAGGSFGFYTPNSNGLSAGSDAWARFEVGYPQLCAGDGLVAYSVPSGYYDVWVAHKDDNCSDNTGIRAGNFYSMTWSP